MIRVNDVAIPDAAILAEADHHSNEEAPLAAAGRALALRELLLQEARQRFAACMDASAAEGEGDALIDRLLEAEVVTPEPTEAECRRYYESHLQRFRSGDLVEASHILFAVTPGTAVPALRAKAEELLSAIRSAPDLFVSHAAQYSNCPSGAVGGSLGQLQRGESVPEFDAELFGSTATGILPRLVKTRFGFHIVRIDKRIAGRQLPFDVVRDRIADYLTARVRQKATQQYLRLLAGKATIEGIDLEGAATPLLQ